MCVVAHSGRRGVGVAVWAARTARAQQHPHVVLRGEGADAAVGGEGLPAHRTARQRLVLARGQTCAGAGLAEAVEALRGAPPAAPGTRCTAAPRTARASLPRHLTRLPARRLSGRNGRGMLQSWHAACWWATHFSRVLTTVALRCRCFPRAPRQVLALRGHALPSRRRCALSPFAQCLHQRGDGGSREHGVPADGCAVHAFSWSLRRILGLCSQACDPKTPNSGLTPCSGASQACGSSGRASPAVGSGALCAPSLAARPVFCAALAASARLLLAGLRRPPRRRSPRPSLRPGLPRPRRPGRARRRATAAHAPCVGGGANVRARRDSARRACHRSCGLSWAGFFSVGARSFEAAAALGGFASLASLSVAEGSSRGC